ncbi:MAG: tetratricopeptide repeat protein [Hyphomicrobiales bacterium]
MSHTHEQKDQKTPALNSWASVSHKDRQGNALSGANPDAVELFDKAVEAFSLYRGDPVDLLDKAIKLAPGFAMAHILKAYMFALATEPEATAFVKQIMPQMRALSMNDRERSHLAALEKLIAGEWTAAALALDYHNMTWPFDLAALQVGHLMDFYRANAVNLRDRIGRALPKWSQAIPGYSLVLGMHAFGLEECGDYALAEESGKTAIDLQPLDSWSHHAVAHVMEMQGRAHDGIEWMQARAPHWAGDDSFFQVHNWWHKALFHIDLGQMDEAIALYDGPVRDGKSALALDLVDASALLWRLHLAGHDVGNRWGELATAWEQHADGKLYPFNDWHASMAYLGAGKESAVETILTAYKDSAYQRVEVGSWAAGTGTLLIKGFSAFWRGNYAEAAENLHQARFITNRFGGSHAQRDIIDLTLTEATIRGGLSHMAEALANERLTLKPHSPVNKNFLMRAKAA